MNQDIIDEFISESREHLDTIEEQLLRLENAPGDDQTINELFRAVHSIKGGAGFFGFMKLNELAHAMENLLYKARNKELTITTQHINVLFNGIDKLRENFEKPESDVDISPVTEAIADLLGPQEEPNKVEIKGKVFNKEDAEFEKFKINERELQKAVDEGLNIFAVRSYLQKDMHDKGKTPYQYTEQISQLGYFIDSYLDIENMPLDTDAEDFDLQFVFLFATVLDKELVDSGIEVDAAQIISIDTAPFKKQIKIKKKDGGVIDLHEKGTQIDNHLLDSGRRQKKQASQAATPATSPTPPPVQPVQPAQPAQPPQAPPQEFTPDPAPANGSDGPADTPENAQPRSKSDSVADETLRVKVSQLNKLVNLAGELVLARNQLISVSDQMTREIAGLHGILQRVNLVTTELQTQIMHTRMQPISIVFNKFPRLLRDLSQKLGKSVRLDISGAEVEVDKTIIEAISDPLTHLIRNVADHGIESPHIRRERGKNEEGAVTLKAYHEGGLVNIEIADDGQGIDPEVIIDKAIQKGLVSLEDSKNLNKKEKINYIFEPGFSTAATVTDVSGRGVGMDVVKTNIEKLGGSVDIDSTLGQGTRVKIILPLTLAIVTSLIVETEQEKFAIPQVSIEELLRIKHEEFQERIATIQGGQVLRIRGKLLPLIHLADSIKLPRTFQHPVTRERLPEKRKQYSTVQLDAPPDTPPEAPLTEEKRSVSPVDVLRVLVVKSGNTQFGLIVDKIIGSEEIVVKPMPQHFRQLKSYAGATILGDGRVALIIDVPGLAEKNKLLFREIESVQARVDETEETKREKGESVNLLLFDVGAAEQFAIPVGLIERVDVLESNQLDQIGSKYYSSYKGFSMRLIHLSDHISLQPPEKAISRYRVVIPKNTDVPIGLLIDKVIDTRELVFQLEEGILKQKGILGSTVIDNKITLLPDLLGILEEAEPNCLKTLREQKKGGNHRKILLAEDTAFYLKMVGNTLMEGGYQVFTAENGLEALQLLEQETVDMVVSDIEMPEMDGFQLLAELKQDSRWQALPVIALTSLSDEKLIKKGLEGGFNRWCVKLDKEILLRTVSDVFKEYEGRK